VNWILDADIRSFFDEIRHDWLLKFVKHRIADRRILRLIGKWLRAGVSEEGQWSETKRGTPQGSVATPRTQKITRLLGGSGRVRARRLRPIGNRAGLRNRDRVTDG
jgi:retron-type reverse transcriptase